MLRGFKQMRCLVGEVKQELWLRQLETQSVNFGQLIDQKVNKW